MGSYRSSRSILAARGKSEKGHAPALPSTEASGRCRFSQATFAGAHGKWRDAPIAVIPGARDLRDRSLRGTLAMTTGAGRREAVSARNASSII